MTKVVRYELKDETRYAIMLDTSLKDVYDVTHEIKKAIIDDSNHEPETGPCFAIAVNHAIKAGKLYETLEKPWLDAGGKEVDRPKLGYPGSWRPSITWPLKTWSW